jgi:hypothetical protein
MARSPVWENGNSGEDKTKRVLFKQYYLADVLAGLLLAFGASWLYGRLLLKKKYAYQPKQLISKKKKKG